MWNVKTKVTPVIIGANTLRKGDDVIITITIIIIIIIIVIIIIIIIIIINVTDYKSVHRKLVLSPAERRFFGTRRPKGNRSTFLSSASRFKT
jgi:uncharacterized membrane protein YqiK